MYDANLHYDTRDWRFAMNHSRFTDGNSVRRCSRVTNF